MGNKFTAKIRQKIGAGLVLTLILLSAIALSGLLSPVKKTSAQELGDINLYPQVPLVRQIDQRWSTLFMRENGAPDQSPDNTYGNCGCLLSALSSLVSFYLPSFGDVSLPRFPVQYSGQPAPALGWSPVYIDHFLRCGAPPHRSDTTIRSDPCLTGPDTNWGYKKVNNACGVQPHPWALENMAISRTYSTGNGTIQTPTGVSMQYIDTEGGPGRAGLAHINRMLRSGQPVVVITDVYSVDGKLQEDLTHSYVIVGYDSRADKFLVLDPTENIASAGPEIPGRRSTGMYEDWFRDITAIITMQPVVAEQHHLSFADDPAPIKFAVTSPEGHRTGYNPTTRTESHDVTNAFTYSFSTEASLLGDSVAGDPAKGMQIDNPVDGIWRTEIVGTGTGPYEIDVLTVSTGIPTKHQTLSGTINNGQIIKHEVKYQRNQAPVLTTVDNFTPEAILGDSRSARTGQNLIFDGRRSWDSDGTVTAWNWDFGDGATASGFRQTHAFASQGEYEVKLTVTDNQGASSTRSIKVAITPAPTISVERASVSTEGIQGNDGSGMTRTPWPVWDPTPAPGSGNNLFDPIKMSRDGRFIAFQSAASNLVANDTNGVADIFIRDQISNTTERVSVENNEQQLSGPSGIPRISVTGRYVIFMNAGHVYLRDRQSNTTERVNINASGQAIAAQQSALHFPIIPGEVSSDGRFVVFSTNASLTPEDTDGRKSVYLRDRQSGTTEWISQGVELDDLGQFGPVMSDDGNKIVFEAFVSSGSHVLYLKNRIDNVTTRVDTDATGNPAQTGSAIPKITSDGKYLVFGNSDLDGDINNGIGIIVKDLQTGEVKGVPGINAHYDISEDGRYVVGTVPSRIPLRFGFDDERWGFAVHDRVEGTTRRVDLTQAGALPNITTGRFVDFSGDGRWVTFSSYGSTFIPFDTNGVPDVYLRDMNTAVPPVADISGPYVGWASRSATDTLYAMTLDGSASADPSGATLKYIWDFGDGSPVQTTTTNTVEHHYMTAGNYKATLVVDNGGEKSSPTTTDVTIKPQLTAAELTPTVPYCAAPGTEVIVTGIGNIPSSARKGWNLANGPLPNTPSNQSGISYWGGRVDYVAKPPSYEYATRLFISAGIIPGTRSVSANGFAVPIIIPCPIPANLPPVPDAGGPYTVSAGDPLTLDGSQSKDPENAELTYTWNFGDTGNSSSTEVKPTHTYTTPGTYYVALAVSDGQITTRPSLGTGYTKVIVTESKLEIKADESTIVAKEGDVITAEGSFSGPAGKELKLSSSSGTIRDVGDGRWEWTDIAPDGPSKKTVTLTVADANNKTASANLELDVANVAPTVQALTISSIGTACREGTSVGVQIFTSDPAGDNDPITGTLEWGDGATANFASTTFNGKYTYAAGSYIITVKVADDDGGSSSKSTNPGQVSVLYKAGSILEPINPDGSSNFKLGSTIPVKIAITDCTGALITTLNPAVGLALIGTSEGTVNEILSSSAADTGNTMRWNGNHYIYNLSTKNSQFHEGKDLEAGRYKLIISEPASTKTEVYFDLRP